VNDLKAENAKLRERLDSYKMALEANTAQGIELECENARLRKAIRYIASADSKGQAKRIAMQAVGDEK